MNFSGIAGSLLLTLGLTAAIMMGGSPLLFINIPSAIIVGLCTLTLGLTTFGATDFLRSAFAARLLIFKLPLSDHKKEHAQILRSLIIYTYAGGIIGFTIGLIQMLATLDDPSTIGGALAINTIAPFYAVILSECILRPAARRIEHLISTTP
jgi:flagellar motor component MotA